VSDAKEIESLRQRFGTFPTLTYEYKVTVPGFDGWVKNLVRRRGEVVLVVPRADNRILLHTKPQYPEGIYRLPTGGIRPREAADVAARRETYEELGFKPSALNLLGVLDNVFDVSGTQYVYPSFVFQTQTYTLAPQPTDPDELIAGFRDASAAELEQVADHLAHLQGWWSDWGKFRATAHAWLTERWRPEE
jgi:8-oxo-dGTP pyrophosphatase MutT (NUDIX family)